MLSVIISFEYVCANIRLIDKYNVQQVLYTNDCALFILFIYSLIRKAIRYSDGASSAGVELFVVCNNLFCVVLCKQTIYLASIRYLNRFISKISMIKATCI